MYYEDYSKIRDSKGMNDYQVAKAAHIGNSTLSDWKHGRSAPKHDKLKRIAEALGVSYSFFIGAETEPQASNVIEYLAKNSDFPKAMIDIVAESHKMDENQLKKLLDYAQLLNNQK